MANPGYRLPNGQGRPPQRQYYDDQYAQDGFSNQRQEGGYTNQRQEQTYNQRTQAYNGYGSEEVEQYDDQQRGSNNQAGQYKQQGGRPQQEPSYQGRYDEQYQHFDNRSSQQRDYQYDDRYHTNGQDRPPVQNSFARPPTRPADGRHPQQSNQHMPGQRDDVNPGYSASGFRPPRMRERILQPEPQEPHTASWDNPFPAFPSKKKPAEPRRTGSGEQRRIEPPAPMASSQDIQRPSTSHSSRQPRAEALPADSLRPHTSQSQRNFQPPHSPLNAPPMPPQNPPRPHTSQSQRGFEPIHNLSDVPTMPVQRPPLGPLPQQGLYQESSADNSMSHRPVPRRAMTGPAPQQSLDTYGSVDNEYPHNGGSGGPAHDEYLSQRYPNPQRDQRYMPEPRDMSQQYSDDRGFEIPPPQPRNTTGPVPNGGGPYGHRRQSSDQSYQRRQSIGFQEEDIGSYRGVPLTKKISPEVPNFDALSRSTNERAEDHLSLLQQQSRPYQKPVYQTSPPLEPELQHSHSVNDGNGLASPLAQFSFDLAANHSSTQPSRAPPTPGNQQQSRPQDYQGSRRPPQSGPDRSMQYPQRITSRTQAAIANDSHNYPANRLPQNNPPFRPGLAQSSTPSPRYERDHLGFDRDQFNSNYNREGDDGFSDSRVPGPQASYRGEPPPQSYEHHLQSRPSFTSQQVPPRPTTANSGRSIPNSNFGPRLGSEIHQRTGMQNPDSLPAHPAPFRPGLMQPTPPAPRPTPPPPPQPVAQIQVQPQLQPLPQPQVHQRIPSQAKPPVEPEPPITIRELNTLREDFKNRPNDHALGLKLAKRLVEAAKVLANENGRADARQTAKNRERYILDAHKIIKRLCSAGYAEAMFYLADCYGQGMLGLASDPKEAFTLYQSAAKLGHAQSAYRVAVCCELGAEEGGGTRRDPLKAVQWYKRAATLGDSPAMYKMGMIQLKGLLGQPKSPREAISWLKRAAERADAENPHALHELGLLYESAQSTDIILKDEQYALQLFRDAADLGYKYSQFRLGTAYEYGLLGLPIDPRMSIAWYSRAAKQGEHQSEFALSGWYLTGSGQPPPGEQSLLPQSDTEAYLWARKAASSGLAKAEYAMGYYTEVGIGVASNIEEAKRWYYRAAAQNHPKARERLEDLKKGGQRMQKTRVSRSNVGKQNEGECSVM